MKIGNSKLNIVIISIVSIILVITSITLIKIYFIDEDKLNDILTYISESNVANERTFTSINVKIDEKSDAFLEELDTITKRQNYLGLNTLETKLVSNINKLETKLLLELDNNGKKINTNLDSDSKVNIKFLSRFNSVDSAIKENNDDINVIISSLSLNGDINNKLVSIENKVIDTYSIADDIKNIIGVSDDNGDDKVFSKLNNISSNVKLIKNNLDTTNLNVSNLSTIIGTSADISNGDTVFSKLNNITSITNTILSNQNEMQEDIDVILSNINLKTVTPATQEVLTNVYQTYVNNNTSSTISERMAYVLNWLRENDYIR